VSCVKMEMFGSEGLCWCIDIVHCYLHIRGNMIDSPDEQHRAERHPSPTATIIEVPLWYPTHRLSTPHLRYSLFVIDKPCPLRYPSFVIHHDHTYSLRTERMRILSRELANNFSTNGQRPAANVSVVPRPREKEITVSRETLPLEKC
jgi:hypothetical protein